MHPQKCYHEKQEIPNFSYRKIFLLVSSTFNLLEQSIVCTLNMKIEGWRQQETTSLAREEHLVNNSFVSCVFNPNRDVK